jgi:hypothetical protein
MASPPRLGQTVLYRSRTGKYTVPAIVTAVRYSLHRPNVDAGFIPDLSSDLHVHLTVFTPGAPGKRAAATDFLVESPHGRSENAGGVYQEWDIAPGDGPGEWLPVETVIIREHRPTDNMRVSEIVDELRRHGARP